jgi:hypothetical protein
MTIEPDVGTVMADSSWTNVDFPDPFAPMMPRHSPADRLKLTLSIARIAGPWLLSLFSLRVVFESRRCWRLRSSPSR